MKPLIGINADFSPETADRGEHSFLYASYYDAVTRAGGLPCVVPPLESDSDIAAILDRLEAFVLTGGGDLDPAAQGRGRHPAGRVLAARREAFDRRLIGELLRRPMPVLAICLGIQAVNVVAGGTLYQHLPDDRPSEIDHRGGQHPVRITAGTRLAAVYPGLQTIVSSTHHQAVDEVASGWRVTATAPDGVIEAIEPADADRFFLAVQWHPERAASVEGGALFDALVRAAGQR